MNLLQSIDPAYVFSGFCVGSLVGLTGVGGGSLMTPVLILVFGVHPVAAVGTDLLYAAATKTIATVVHGLGGTIDWKIVARLASGSLPSTALTVWILSHFDMGAAGHLVPTWGGALGDGDHDRAAPLADRSPQRPP